MFGSLRNSLSSASSSSPRDIPRTPAPQFEQSLLNNRAASPALSMAQNSLRNYLSSPAAPSSPRAASPMTIRDSFSRQTQQVWDVQQALNSYAGPTLRIGSPSRDTHMALKHVAQSPTSPSERYTLSRAVLEDFFIKNENEDFGTRMRVINDYVRDIYDGKLNSTEVQYLNEALATDAGRNFVYNTSPLQTPVSRIQQQQMNAIVRDLNEATNLLMNKHRERQAARAL